MKSFFYKHFFFLLNILSFISCFYLIFMYLHYDVLTGHDHFYPFEYTADFSAFFNAARFVSRFIVAAFVVYIPNILNVHPNDLTNTLIPFFNALFLSIMSLFSLKIFYFFSKKKESIFKKKSFFLLYPAIFIMISVIPLINEDMSMFYFSSLAETVTFYDHLFNFIFFVIFLYSIIKCIFYKIENNYEKIFYFINTFLLGVSFEMLTFVSVVFIILISSFLSYIYKERNLENKQKLFFLFSNTFILIISSLCHFGLSGYFSGKIAGYESHVENSFLSIKEIFLPFMQDYFNIVIKENIWFLIIIVLLSIFVFLIKDEKKDNKKVVLLSLTLVFSIFIFFFFLIIGGECEVYRYNFWLNHVPFRILYFKILLLILLFYFGYIIYFYNKIRVSFLYSLLLIFSLYSIIFLNFNEIKYEYKYQQIYAEDIRETAYITDKISLLYNKYDGIALLPISAYEKYASFLFLYRPRCYDADSFILGKMVNIINEELNAKKSRVFSYLIEDENYFDNDYLSYLYYTYGIKLEGIIFVDDEVALKEFERRGGTFTKEELKKTNFSYLKKKFKQELSLKELNALIKNNENKNYLYAARGRYYNSDEKYEKAITDYTKSINLSDSNYYNQYLLLRAESYFGKNDYDKAIKDYSDFIKNSPYSIEIRKRLANTYIENSQKVEALEQYKELAEIFPYYNELGTKKTFYNDMANLYYEIQDYQKVIECINEDEVLNGYNVNYKLRALAKMRLNDYKSAYADILKAEKYNIDEKQEILHLKQELEQNVYNPYN